MWGRRWWDRVVTGRAPSTGPTAAERAGVVRRRLATLEVQQLELLTDESIPGRKHRLDAVRDARRDLEEELALLSDAVDPGAPRAGG